MKKFTQVREEVESKKFYQAKAEITLQVTAENEGEAGYLFDRALGSIQEQVNFTLQNIEEIPALTEKKTEEEGSAE
jgi:hypothetical protein